MRITGKPHSTGTSPATSVNLTSKQPHHNPHLDLNASSLKPPRRRTNKDSNKSKSRNPSLTRFKRLGTGALVGKRSRPETPLTKWKIEDRNRNVAGVDEEEDDHKVEEEENKQKKESGGRRGRRRSAGVVSARKLAAGLWRLQLPEAVGSSGGGERRSGRDQIGFQPGAGHVGISFLPHRSSKVYGSDTNDLLQSPSSLTGVKNRFLSRLEPSCKFSNSAMEGATKWDPVCMETADEAHQIYSRMKHLDQQVSAVSMVSALEAEMEQARARIQELENERRSSKKKLEQFLKKVSEERAAWRSREHEKIRAFINDIKTELSRERKNRQRLEIVNSKLVNELADSKVSAKRFMQDYEKERKDRELIEDVCDELAKEIGEDKAEIEAMKRDSMKIREEVDEERKMLQMAEVWREERVQMKLIDAKVALEQKYSQMNRLVADIETFLKSRNAMPDVKEMREAESLIEAAASVCVQDFKQFTYEPPNPDIFAVFEEVNYGESNERDIEQCVASPASKIHTVSPEVIALNKDRNHRHSDAFIDQNGDVVEEEDDDDESDWETVSHPEDQGSSYSPEGSAASVNKNHWNSNFSGSGTEWEGNACEEMPITEISEICSVPSKQLKKASSIARLWRSGPNNGDNYKIISVDGMNCPLSNGRKSNVSTVSPDRGSGKSGVSPPDLVAQWSSPETGNPHITRAMKGCIEWPRGAQKNSLKARLLEARMESQKVQLRHVLKQKF